jgi:hypothetical protein
MRSRRKNRFPQLHAAMSPKNDRQNGLLVEGHSADLTKTSINDNDERFATIAALGFKKS